MAKFTVYFKDKAIQAGVFDSGIVHIGRDDTNDVVVDSLAVAPAHAVAVVKGDDCVIKQLNEEFPLVVNNQRAKEWNLRNNDIVNIGKHYILYQTTGRFQESVFTAPVANPDPDLEDLNRRLDEAAKSTEANLQVMNGIHIGRVLRIRKAMTRIGHDGAGVVVIARRKDGYFVSALQGHDGLAVNREPLGDRIVRLNAGDVIVVDNVEMKFFPE